MASWKTPRLRPVEVGGHARAAGVVVGGDLEEVGEVAALGVVLFGAIEGAEGHGLHQVEAEGLGRRDGFGEAVELGLRALEAVGPERLPAEDLGILEQQPPEGGEVAVGDLLGRGAEELADLAVAGLRARNGDAEVAGLGQAELAEAGGVAAAGEQAVERALALAAPGDAVDQFGIADEQGSRSCR